MLFFFAGSSVKSWRLILLPASHQSRRLSGFLGTGALLRELRQSLASPATKGRRIAKVGHARLPLGRALIGDAQSLSLHFGGGCFGPGLGLGLAIPQTQSKACAASNVVSIVGTRFVSAPPGFKLISSNRSIGPLLSRFVSRRLRPTISIS